ncbi:hypothetical protein [Nonomuraea sp. NPDC050310]|uniref:hypothetical protein n=1 Tax=Nonomuraea sp. NPDC050310 TaxID=3154935 RepID=UPI0033D759B3
MSSGRNTVMVYLCVTGALVLAGLIAFAPRVIWLSALAFVAVIMLIALGRIGWRHWPPKAREHPEPVYEPLPPPLPIAPREQRIDQVPLPSREADYDFLFSAVVLWTPVHPLRDERQVNLAALAVDAILTRAREVTERREPGRAPLVAHELGGILGTMQKDPTEHVLAMAEGVQVALSAQDQERLDKLAEVRKDQVVWEHDRKYEQSKREYLGGDVLKDTGSAVVWWLVKNDDQVEKTVNDIGLLATLSSAANNKTPTEEAADFFAPKSPMNGASPVEDLAAFLHSLDLDGERDLFAHQIALLVRNYGRPEAAEEILRRFGLTEPNLHLPEQPWNDEA